MRKLTTAQFIEKAKAVHGGRYGYEKTVYVDTSTPVTIVCPSHGDFPQSPNSHLQGRGCRACGYEKVSAGLQADTASFIAKARALHGERYDYSQVVYQDSRTPVTIVCPDHGPFPQTANRHLQGCGCPTCGFAKTAEALRMTAAEFITKAREAHENRYDYAITVYMDYATAVTITCPKHGDFRQRPNDHLSGRGCHACGLERTRVALLKHDLEGFITAARAVHSGLYGYEAVTYVNSTTPVTVTCSIHGPFPQLPCLHVKGHGCPACSYQERSEAARHSTADFVARAQKVHGERYDYTETVYTTSKDKVIIGCRVLGHGNFSQKPTDHVGKGAGCPCCAQSNGETAVAVWLDAHGITAERQWSYPMKAAGTRARLRADFLLADERILIEYDGEQHFKPVRWTARTTDAEVHAAFTTTQKRDARKNRWAAENGYKMVRIPYDKARNRHDRIQAYVFEYLDTHLLPLLKPRAEAAD